MKNLILNANRFIACSGLLLTLVACGGGGGGGDVASQPPATATVIDVSAALKSYQHGGNTRRVTGSGTLNGLTGTATGTITQLPPTQQNFENTFTYVRTTGVSLTLTNGSGTALASGYTSYYYNTVDAETPIGYSVLGQQYGITTTKTSLPTSAKAGDKGDWYTLTVYTDSTKAFRLGTIEASYEVLPDRLDTLLLVVTTRSGSMPGGGTSWTSFRVSNTPYGSTATPLEQYTSAINTNYTLTYQ